MQKKIFTWFTSIVMRVNSTSFTNNSFAYHGSFQKMRFKDGLIQEDGEVHQNDIENDYRPAERASLSGSERLKENEVAFKGDPKRATKIAAEVLKKGQNIDISGITGKMGGANWFKGLINAVDKNEALYNAFVVLIVAGVLKPVCVLAMPGAEREDKEMSATKNTVSALIGFALSNIIMSPCSAAVNKIINSFDSKNPTQFIKDPNFVKKLQMEELGDDVIKLFGKELKPKSSLGEAFKTTYKSIWEVGISPIKGAITIALLPVVLKLLFGKNKKSEENKQTQTAQAMPIMNSIKIDKNKKEQARPSFGASMNKNPLESATQASQPVAFKGMARVPQTIILDEAKEVVSNNAFKKFFKLLGRGKNAYDNAVAVPISHIIAFIANSKPGQILTKGASFWDKISARWGDIASIAITASYVSNTMKSDKIEKERKFPLAANNIMVTVASSLTAFLIDKYTDKPMDNVLRSYLKNREVEIFTENNKNIVKTVKNALDGKQDFDLTRMTHHSDDILKEGIDNLSSNLKDAIKALSGNSNIKEGIKAGLFKQEDIAKMVAAGFDKETQRIFKNIAKTKSLTIFTITVRFLVTVLMTPIVGRFVAFAKNRFGKEGQKTGSEAHPAGDNQEIGMKDFVSSLNK